MWTRNNWKEQLEDVVFSCKKDVTPHFIGSIALESISEFKQTRKRSGMQNRNYQKELEKLIENNQREGRKPSLLLHSCCAPCSSYVLEYLAPYFRIYDFYYNPNISPKKEYEDRKDELVRLIDEMKLSTEVTFLEGTYQPEDFFAMAKGLEDVPEGGERCFLCYEMRLREAAKMAKEQGTDYFATTLTISPLKNAAKLNEIGERLSAEYGVAYLPSDFKKKNGYKRSVELSAQYDLYRQNYCGCVFSKRQAEKEMHGGE